MQTYRSLHIKTLL